MCVCVMCVSERELCFSWGMGGALGFVFVFAFVCFFLMQWSLAGISGVCMF